MRDLPYHYSTSAKDGTNIILAGKTKTASIEIAKDFDFVANFIQARFKDDRLLVKVTIGGEAINNDNWPYVSMFTSGPGMGEGSIPSQPFRLVIPWYCPAGQSVVFDYFDLSGIDNECVFTLLGYKVRAQRDQKK